MNKVTIFTGEQNTGKTKEAERLCGNYIKCFWAKDFYDLKYIPDDTDILVIDGADIEDKQLQDFLSNEVFRIRKAYGAVPENYIRPETIVTTNMEVPEELAKLGHIEVRQL